MSGFILRDDSWQVEFLADILMLTDIPLPALGNVDKFFGRKKSCDFFDRDVG